MTQHVLDTRHVFNLQPEVSVLHSYYQTARSFGLTIFWITLQYPSSGMMQQGGHYMQPQQAQQMTQQQQLLAARSSLLYSQQPYAALQQQQGQLGMSSGGSAGLHMLQSEATNVGGNAIIGTGGGFPDFGRSSAGDGLHGNGKREIGGSAEGRGGSSGGHSGDAGETLYLKTSGDGN